MKKSRKLSAAIALMLTVAVATPSLGNSGVEAAKKPKLSTKSISVQVGASKTVSVKNYTKKVTWKIKKAAIAKIKAKKTSCKVTGKKKGSTQLTATIKQGKKKKVLTCKVKVSDKKVAATEAPTEVAATTAPTQAPAQPTVQQPANTPAPTEDPDATATPTPTYDYDADMECEWKQPGEKLKDLYSKYFICGVSTESGSLRNGESAALIRYHFNSTTLGNGTKHESLVVPDKTDEHPEGLEAANVENYYKTNGEGKIILKYDTLEDVLSYCKANGIKLRYHAFVWHAQVREYFFLQDFNTYGFDEDDYAEKGWDVKNYHKLADKETMKKRLNDYISQIVEYIYSHGYGEVVYAYDVINEATNGNSGNIRYYVDENASSIDSILSTSGSGQSFQTSIGVRTQDNREVTTNSSPADVESMLAKEGRGVNGDHSYWYATMGTDYLYLSYLYAYNAIQENFAKYKDQFGYKEENLPSLIYNDYNQRENDHLALATYINKACNMANGTEGIKYCKGIGLQSHSIGESTQERMIKTIADKGYEVQITELDEGQDGDALANKLSNLYKLYAKYSKNGEYGQAQGDDYIGVTSVTQWGICDNDGSWGSGNIHYMFKYIIPLSDYNQMHENTEHRKWIADAKKKYLEEYGREPTVEEIKKETGLNDEGYEKAMEAEANGEVAPYRNISPKAAYFKLIETGKELQ